VKTIVSRAGEGTKIVLTGDPYQIDNPYMDSTNNGLVHVVNRFRGERIAGHVTLFKGERSPLAELAANLL
jgi:PhoH-like ATPase